MEDLKSSLDTKNEPKNLKKAEAKSEVKKYILDARVRQYPEREAIFFSNMNKNYGIICVKFTPGLQSVFKGNENFPSKSIYPNPLWIMQETKNITVGLDVKLNKSSSLYHCIIILFTCNREKIIQTIL